MGAPNWSGLDDAALMQRIRARDEEALGALYDRYAPLLFSLALQMCRQEWLAEEVLQDVFVSVWRAAASWQPERGSLRLWLVVMTRRKAIDALRAQGRTPLPLLDATARDETEPADVADVLEDRIVAREVRVALERLPAKYRDILEAAYFSGLTQREIAERFGLPHGTVKSRLRLAVERLARLLRARGIDR